MSAPKREPTPLEVFNGDCPSARGQGHHWRLVMVGGPWECRRCGRQVAATPEPARLSMGQEAT